MFFSVKAFIERLSKVERVVMVLTLLIMTAVLLAEIIGREIVGQGIFGATRFATYMMIWTAYLGLDVATSHGSHLRPQFSDNWLPARWEPAVVRLRHLVSMGIHLVMAGAAVTFVQESYQFGERAAVLGWPTWPVQIVLPLAFGLSALRHLSYAVYPDLAPADKEMLE